MNKKDIPLELLTLVEPIIQKNLDILSIEKEEGVYYYLKEIDPKSSNYFKIYNDKSAVNARVPQLTCRVSMKPRSKTDMSVYQATGKIVDSVGLLKSWIDKIRTYNDTISVYDDNFSKVYEEHFYSEVEILDDDKYVAPFNPEQQQWIEDRLIILWDQVKELPDSIPIEAKEEMITEIQETIASLPNSTKDAVIKNISKLYSKGYKLFKSLGNEFLKVFKSEGFKKIAGMIIGNIIS